MKNQILSIILFLFSIQSCLAQTNDPIWDIGTKWTYESFTGDGTVTWVTNDILDTLTINNKKLYEVASFLILLEFDISTMRMAKCTTIKFLKIMLRYYMTSTSKKITALNIFHFAIHISNPRLHPSIKLMEY